MKGFCDVYKSEGFLIMAVNVSGGFTYQAALILGGRFQAGCGGSEHGIH